MRCVGAPSRLFIPAQHQEYRGSGWSASVVNRPRPGQHRLQALALPLRRPDPVMGSSRLLPLLSTGSDLINAGERG